METFTMSRKETLRAGLVKAALANRITNEQGAHALGMTSRQFQRIKQRFRVEGVAGLVHRARGRPSRRTLPSSVRAAIETLMTTTYDRFNDVHLTEKLREVHGLAVSRASVRRIRLVLRRPAHRRRRPPKHRARRIPAPALGELVQLDASPYRWLEERGPAAALHGAIDDATSIPLALWFRPTEDFNGYLRGLDHTCRTDGVPVELYGDRLNVFVRNDQHWTLAEQLRGAQDPTHFGRVLRDLGIGFIRAHSPQAKGRIERLWATLQDRLVSELRLRGIATLEAANAFLPEFIADFNRRFARAAAAAPMWRRPPRDLDLLLSCRYHRVAARDNTLRLGSRLVQIPRGPHGRSYARRRVEVRELLDGRLVVLAEATVIATMPASRGEFTLVARRSPNKDRRRARVPRPLPASAALRRLAEVFPTPAPRHPWRRAYNPFLAARAASRQDRG